MCNCWSGREALTIGQVTLSLLYSAFTEWEWLMFSQFLKTFSSTSQCLSRPGEPSFPLQVFESRPDAVQTYHPPSSWLCFPVCFSFLGCVMQFQSPVILYLKACPLQEYSGATVHYHLLNYVVMLGTCPGWCKSWAIWYCSLFSGAFWTKKNAHHNSVLFDRSCTVPESSEQNGDGMDILDEFIGAEWGICCRFKLSIASAAKLAVQIPCREVSFLLLIQTQELHLILELSLSLYKIQWRAGKEV